MGIILLGAFIGGNSVSNPALDAMVKDLADAIRIDNAKDVQIAALLSQVANPPLIFPGLQGVGEGPKGIGWEPLWGVGRNKPVNNPAIHGTYTLTPGPISKLQFNPAVLNPPEADNLYVLRRLASYVPVTRLQRATAFTFSITFGLSDARNTQAFETDYQRQLDSDVWSMGLQLLPGSPKWTLRNWQYVAGSWKDTGIRVDPALFTGGKMLQMFGEFNCTDTTSTLTAVTFNGGQRQILNMQQPIARKQNSINEFNVAYQCDAKLDGSPWAVQIADITVSLS